MGGGKRSQKMEVTRYFMSLDYAYCYGPIDSLNHLEIKDKIPWAGLISQESSIRIDKPNLFGGLKKEGGLDGIVEVYTGSATQKMSDALAARFGLTPDTAPGYRGISHLFFRGLLEEERNESLLETILQNIPIFRLAYGIINQGQVRKMGFEWGANNPFLPGVKANITRVPKGLGAGTASIFPPNPNRRMIEYPPGYNATSFNEAYSVRPNANPAHMIHEVLTNAEWGMGAPSSMIGDSFAAAAQTLYDENFGLSIMWTKQASIEKYIQEILDHIQGILYLDQATGKWELVLIREGYDGEIIELDETNCEVFDRQRMSISETINEIVVTWTDPATEEPQTYTIQDIGNMAVQGGTVSDSRDYYGVRNEELAAMLATRDLRTASYPLFSCTIKTEQGVANFTPGKLVNLSYADDGIANIQLRISKVEYGDAGSSAVTLTCTENIYGIGEAEYFVREQSAWESPSVPPQPLEIYSIQQAPLPLILRSGISASDIEDEDYPLVTNMVFGNNVTQDLTGIDVHGEVTRPNGDVVEDLLFDIGPTPVRLSEEVAPQEVETVFSGDFIRRLAELIENPLLGSFIMFGTDQATSEIAMLDTYDEGEDEFTVARGLFDTVPREHPVGTPIWFIGDDLDNMDPTEQIDGAESYYKLFTETQGGLQEDADALVVEFTPGPRPYCPFRPANVEINGTMFTMLTFSERAPGGVPANLTATWSNRDRTVEDTIAARWDEGNVTPEAGQTTTIRVVSEVSGDVVYEETGITGTTATIPTASLTDGRFYGIRFYAERDGFESIQYAEHRIEIVRFGYGAQYGYNYGSPV